MVATDGNLVATRKVAKPVKKSRASVRYQPYRNQRNVPPHRLQANPQAHNDNREHQIDAVSSKQTNWKGFSIPVSHLAHISCHVQNTGLVIDLVRNFSQKQDISLLVDGLFASVINITVFDFESARIILRIS